ncbi:hypothetical protein BV898_01747 [Hypsibius exemplaris]|uniref:EDR1/CTR1/ARMC3-like peptidase-like domain-containing protein n=1 Tax=Hypsibius exemplaris TaxID=2072580 RepID=A0A1W0XBA7_HYPEX|nr:hypothetical protein BV898_01747 [Hypsibius exemplaris]
MDRTFSWCEETPFVQFQCHEDDPDVETVDPAELEDVKNQVRDYDELDDAFSDEDYDFLPDRPYSRSSKRVSVPKSATLKHGSSFDFAPADIDLLNRLIDSQFSPGNIPATSAVAGGIGNGPAITAFTEVASHQAPESSHRKEISPLITSEIFDNPSSHRFPTTQTHADVPTLVYQFDAVEDCTRRHRHQPRRVKFVYEDPAARVVEEEEVPAPHPERVSTPLTTVAPVKVAPKGKGKSPPKENAETKPAKGKAAKGKGPVKPDPHHEAPPVIVIPPPDALVWDTPVWRTSNQTHLQFHNKKAWIIEKKRRKHWFRLENLTPELCHDEPDTRLPLWTKAGDRIPRHYSLRFVIKNPKTMQLFFFQKKKRYILTALRVSFLFSEQSTRMKLRILSIPGLVRRLVQLITYCTGLPQRLAIMLLASLSHANAFVRLFCKVGALKKLEPIIRNSRDPELNIWLALLIRNMSQNTFVQRQFLEMLLLDVFLDWVAAKDQEPDVVKYLLQTLYFVCRNRTMRTYLVVRGSFVAILELLFSHYRYIQYLTFRLLQKLLRTRSGKPIYRFDKADGMMSLVTFISDNTQRKFFPLCIEVLEYVLSAPAIAREMIESGLYRSLMDLAMERAYENTASVQEFALKTTTRAAEIEEERRIMHELGYESNVVYFLKSNDVKVQVAALQAIAGLCRRPTNQTALFDLGAHRIILFLMEGAQSGVREWAFYAIAFLIFRNKHIMNSMVSKGLGDVIYEALWDEGETWETKGNALLCAILLRKNEHIRQRLSVSVSQSIPHWLLNSNRRIRNYAAVSIGIFVTDEETRTHFMDCKGFKALSMACTMSQILSKEKPELEFTRNLCFGLAALAVNEETVWAFINAGSLTPLWLLKNEADRVSQGYVGLAVHRIVALDSIFKYALLGRLEDKLPHGLHDQGVITLANPLRPVEFFTQQGLMGDRTIVYVSLPKKYWKRSQTPESCTYRAPKDGLDLLCDAQAGIRKRDVAHTKPMGLERLEQSLPPQDMWTYAPYNPELPPDLVLNDFLTRARSLAAITNDTMEKVKALSGFVVHQQGGPVTSRNLCEWNDCVDVGLSFIKRKINSNCVPLGMIQQGNSLHRALLFKVLADVSELPVTLIRGESPNQGWIEVLHQPQGSKRPDVFVIDLLHEVGTLLPRISPLAKQYTQPPKLPRSDGNVGPRPSFSTRDVRPLRGVMSDARQQLLQSDIPHRSTKEEPEREIQMRPEREKLRLFQLTRVFDGRNPVSGKSRYRPRLVKLFRNFVAHGVLQRKTILLKAGESL